MVFDHDFDKFPELSNQQLETLELSSPHPQIKSDFEGFVEKVKDGDTVTILTSFRDFSFPVRLLNIDAPEKGELGGEEATDYLKKRVEGRHVRILIDPRQRVGKYGRLLGRIVVDGLDVAEELLNRGLVYTFGNDKEYEPFNLDKLVRSNQWF